MRDNCPRCGSDKIIPELPLMDHYGDTGTFSNPATVKAHGKPEAWVFTESVAGRLFVRICGECGHAQLQVGNFRELYATYQKSQGK